MDWAARQRGASSGERGFILALLLGVCTVMGIFLQKGIPAVRAEVQRELEAELIYRGEHLRNGIRMYQARTGGFPSSLEQLTKLRPRLVRKIYKDPMTRAGDWDLIYAVLPGKTGDMTGLPIVGVRSKSQKDSFRVYRQKTIYSDWAFSASDNLLGIPGSGEKGGGDKGGGIAPGGPGGPGGVPGGGKGGGGNSGGTPPPDKP